MGVGSALSRYLNRGLVYQFIWIELLLGVIGGFSSALLMLAFAFTQGFELILYALVIVMGVLVGLEIPLLMHVKDRYDFRDVIAHVLIVRLLLGALKPLWSFQFFWSRAWAWFVPRCCSASSMPRRLVEHVPVRRAAPHRPVPCVQPASWCLWAGHRHSPKNHRHSRRQHLRRRTIFAYDSRYQHLVLTRFKDDLRLFLEQPLAVQLPRRILRIVEALIHPGLSSIPAPRRVLCAGSGGDGPLSAKIPSNIHRSKNITLVDLDPENDQDLLDQSRADAVESKSLLSPKTPHHQRRRVPLGDSNTESFDFIVIDFPDPTNYSLGNVPPPAFYHVEDT